MVVTDPRQLRDEEMRDFVRRGFHTLHSGLLASTHSDIHHSLQKWFASHDNPGNDILGSVPALADLFSDPALDGALTSILGPDYLVHRHRHCHDHQAGAEAQQIHKDYPVGGNVRDHHPRSVLILYYPHEVTAEMGPTAVQPMSQHNLTPRGDLAEITLCCDAGTLVIVHYEIWHRATQNSSDRDRFMVKFVATRTREPSSNGARAPFTEWTPGGENWSDHDTICSHIWSWYHGESGSPQAVPAVSDGRPIADIARSFDEDEGRRTGQLYQACAQENNTDSELLGALVAEAKARCDTNLKRSDFTNPSQLDMAMAFSARGTRSVASLSQALSDSDWRVRSAAAITLGMMGRAARCATRHLVVALNDKEEWVRRNAAEALGTIGPEAVEAVSPLTAALEDKRVVTRWSLSHDGFRESCMLALLKILGPGKGCCVDMLSSYSDDASEYVACFAGHIVGKHQKIL